MKLIMHNLVTNWFLFIVLPMLVIRNLTFGDDINLQEDQSSHNVEGESNVMGSQREDIEDAIHSVLPYCKSKIESMEFAEKELQRFKIKHANSIKDRLFRYIMIFK